MKTLTKIVTATILSAISLTASARITVFPVNTFNWTQIGGSVSSSSSTSGWVTGQEANGVCTYSYNVNGITYGPFQISAETCNVSLFSNSVNGIRHSTVKVNGTVVFVD